MKLSVSKNGSLVSLVDLDQFDRAPLGVKAHFYLGRAETCHLILNDVKVSREHVEIVRDGENWSMKSLSHALPAWCNGVPVTETPLKHGDMILIGPFALQVGLEVKTPVASVVEDVDSDTQTIFHSPSGRIEPAIIQTADEPSVPLAEMENQTLSLEDSSEVSSDLANSNELEFEEGSSPSTNALDDMKLESSSEGGNDFGSSEAESENSSFDAISDQGDYAISSLDDNSSMEDGTQVLKSFAKFELEIVGEYAPYDRYLLEAKETFIGRDAKKCQIVLNDPEVSSVHAVIRRENIICVLEDFKSSNGTLLNGVRINKSEILPDDEFIIGGTSFALKVKSDFLKEEAQMAMPVSLMEEVEVEEVVEVQDSFSSDETSSNLGSDFGSVDSSSDGGKVSLLSKIKNMPPKKRIIYGVVLLALIFFLLDEGDTKKAPPKKVTKSNLLETKEVTKPVISTTAPSVKLTKEQQEFVEANYQLAKELFDQGRYVETIFEIEKIFSITPEYKNAKQIYALSKEGVAKLEEIERKRVAEEEKQIRKKKVKDLVEKAQVATKERKRELAESLFVKIMELDPENYEVAQMRLDLEAWVREQEAIELAKTMKESERKRKVEQLRPAKELYLKEKWYSAISKLEEFLQISNMDEDLTTEAVTMLKISKENLKELIDPLIGKAKSLKEGQDLKGAYEAYKEVLIYNPSEAEALNEMNAIRDDLTLKAKKVYRQAIVSESLSLFDDAKDKFKEVQELAPTDNEYYKKASDKLKEYLDP